jgi:hypothetical protein
MNADSQGKSVKWPSRVFRFIAIANFVFVSLGLLGMGGEVLFITTAPVANSPAQPHFLQAFWTMTAINFVLLLWLALGGIRLLQLRVQGVTICNSVFVTEILYYLIIIPFSGTLSSNIAGASGEGNMGIFPQLITAYSLIALVGLNLARRRLLLRSDA